MSSGAWEARLFTLEDLDKEARRPDVLLLLRLHGEHSWGDWWFDPLELCLWFGTKEHARYPIQINRFGNASTVLDTIAQVAGKPWATSSVVGDLVFALNDLLYLQQNACSGGANLEFDATKIVRARCANEPDRYGGRPFSLRTNEDEKQEAAPGASHARARGT